MPYWRELSPRSAERLALVLARIVGEIALVEAGEPKALPDDRKPHQGRQRLVGDEQQRDGEQQADEANAVAARRAIAGHQRITRMRKAMIRRTSFSMAPPRMIASSNIASRMNSPIIPPEIDPCPIVSAPNDGQHSDQSSRLLK